MINSNHRRKIPTHTLRGELLQRVHPFVYIGGVDLSINPRLTLLLKHRGDCVAASPEHAAKVREMLGLLAAAQKQAGDTCPLTVANPKSAKWSPPENLPAQPDGKAPARKAKTES